MASELPEPPNDQSLPPALLSELVDGTLSEVQRRELEVLLTNNPQRQTELVDFLILHDLLDERLGPEGLVGMLDMLSMTSGEADGTQSLTLAPRRATWRRAGWAGALAASLLVASSLGTLTWMGRPGELPPIDNQLSSSLSSTDAKSSVNDAKSDVSTVSSAEIPVPEVPIAELAGGFQFEFTDDSLIQDGAFSAGLYQLNRGAVGLLFSNGTKFVVEAPAEFEIIDAMTVALKRGRVRSHVPDAAHGFTILTPDFDVEDLGTEFGVSVQDDRSAKVRVFAGKVRVHQEGKLTRELGAGRAIAWEKEDWADLNYNDKNNDIYLTPADVGLRRWTNFKTQLVRDPSLVFYYDFKIDPANPRIVPNIAGDHQLRGTIRGGASVQGRWPGSSAMLFETFDHSVENNIPGEYEAFTISAWIQLNGLSWPSQTILNTHGWPMRTHHLNITRNGALDGGIRRDPLRDGPTDLHLQSAERTLRLGAWTHVVAAINVKDRHAAYYVDGREVLSEQIELPSETMVFGPSSIGNWKGSVRDSGVADYARPMCGRIDDLALFNRALAKDEIKLHYEAGKGFE